MMVFNYPTAFQCQHGPYGYKRYATYKDWLRDEFLFRCVYCLTREMWYPTRAASFGVDHIRPKGVARFKKLTNVYDNLAYACNRCNSRKGTNILLDPRRNPFGTHLRVNPDGTIVGLTPHGNDLILALGLDDEELMQTRVHYLDIYNEFQNVNERSLFVERSYLRAFRYPDDIPNLVQKSPKGNTKPRGARRCHYQRHRGRHLTSIYGF